jgi:hypothetical protein
MLILKIGIDPTSNKCEVVEVIVPEGETLRFERESEATPDAKIKYQDGEYGFGQTAVVKPSTEGTIAVTWKGGHGTPSSRFPDSQ